MTKLDQVRDELRRIYADLASEIAEVGPVCVLSGRCCRFGEYGHTLFLSAPEAMVLLADAPEMIGDPADRSGCPWQDGRGHCTAREARPLGCRVYYCEDSYQEVSHDLSERFLMRLKRVAVGMEIAWDYAPLHDHLSRSAGPIEAWKSEGIGGESGSG